MPESVERHLLCHFHPPLQTTLSTAGRKFIEKRIRQRGILLQHSTRQMLRMKKHDFPIDAEYSAGHSACASCITSPSLLPTSRCLLEKPPPENLKRATRGCRCAVTYGARNRNALVATEITRVLGFGKCLKAALTLATESSLPLLDLAGSRLEDRMGGQLQSSTATALACNNKGSIEVYIVDDFSILISHSIIFSSFLSQLYGFSHV